MTARGIFWLIVLATVGIYATMLMWSIPAISEEAAGLIVFDMLPAGYSFVEAHAFLSALTPQGEQFYLNVQHRLDMFYPALLALMTGWAMIRLLPTWRWRFVLLFFPIPGMVFDYLENNAVAVMLATGPDGLTQEMVAQASMYSRLKAGFTTLSLGLLCVLILIWVVKRWRRKSV